MSKSIKEIQDEFERAGIAGFQSIIEEYKKDARAGVVRLIIKYEKKKQAFDAELLRLDAMTCFERKYASYAHICGIDEVGRGPLAGPVVAAAVILPIDCRIMGINDSKKLTAAKRELLYDEIMGKAKAVGLGFAGPKRIDEINILQATYEAMRCAVNDLKTKPDILLNDAVTIPNITIQQIPIIKGDAKSISIAAASIIAKVTRDRMMKEYHLMFPEYSFDKNKGYGSQQHIEAIKKYGPTPLHRRSFIGNFI